MKSILFFFFLLLSLIYATQSNTTFIRQQFLHAYHSYKSFGFPFDELLPLSCKGRQSWIGGMLTLIDCLDSLVVFGEVEEFDWAVGYLLEHLSFDQDRFVSVFEANIRVLGGLLSAHLLAIDPSSPGYLPWYSTLSRDVFKPTLLTLSYDLAQRLLPAFDSSPYGIPYGSLNLRSGVHKNETPITCTAGTGTFSLEFGLLSELTGDPRFHDAAKRAVRSTWRRRSPLNLLGNHLNIQTGVWSLQYHDIGAGGDSFFEYLLKSAVFFNDGEYFEIFKKSYLASETYSRKNGWYFPISIDSGLPLFPPIFNSLQAFWPGLQIFNGHYSKAHQTLINFHYVWNIFGALPEGFNIVSNDIQVNQEGYPLRPELAESIYFFSRAFPSVETYSAYALDIAYAIEDHCRVPCGFASLSSAKTHQHTDRMESFFIAETLKYLYLTFDTDNFFNTGNYIFTTEGHLFPMHWKDFVFETCEDDIPLRILTSIKKYFTPPEKKHYTIFSEKKDHFYPPYPRPYSRCNIPPLSLRLSSNDFFIGGISKPLPLPSSYTPLFNQYLEQQKIGNGDQDFLNPSIFVFDETGGLQKVIRIEKVGTK